MTAARHDTPKFQQLHDRIVHSIARGELRDGDAVPSVRRVAAQHGVNPATVHKAYELLRSEGIIVTADRSGSVVSVPARPTDQAVVVTRQALEPVLAHAVARGVSAGRIRSLVDVLLGEMDARTS